MIVPGPGFHIGQVGHVGGVGGEPAQVAALDQIANGARDHQVLPQQAHALGPRGCAQADEEHVLPAGHQFFDDLGAHVALVHDDQRRLGDFPPRQGLDGNHLHPRQRVRPRMAGLHDADVRDAFSLEGADSLIDQADRRRGKDHAVSLGETRADQVAGDERLAKTGWALANDAPVSLASGLVDQVERSLLVGAQRLGLQESGRGEQIHHDAPPGFPIFWMGNVATFPSAAPLVVSVPLYSAPVCRWSPSAFLCRWLVAEFLPGLRPL